MTFHEVMINAISRKINGIPNHYGKKHEYVEGYVPDIIVKKDHLVEVHEVEVIKNKPYSNKVRRVLWIAMNGAGNWDEINVVKDDRDYHIKIEPKELKVLSLSHEIQGMEQAVRGLEQKLDELIQRKKDLEEKIKSLQHTLRQLRMKRVNLKRAIQRQSPEYDPEWDKHLLEEFKIEMNHFKK